MIKFFINKTEEKMKKIEKQFGISQILVLVIMAVVAIALPITTKLVQQSQENRSQAAGIKFGDPCDPSKNSHTCGTCTNKHSCVLMCRSSSKKWDSVSLDCSSEKKCQKRTDGKASNGGYECVSSSSSSSDPSIYQGATCITSQINNTKCVSGVLYICDEKISTNGPVWRNTKESCTNSTPYSPPDTSCSSAGGSCKTRAECSSGTVITGSGCGSSEICCKATSGGSGGGSCSSSNCGVCSTNSTCSSANCIWHYGSSGDSGYCTTPSTTCGTKYTSDASCVPQSTASSVCSVVYGIADTCKGSNTCCIKKTIEIGTAYTNSTKCKNIKGQCGTFSKVLNAGACKVGDISGVIYVGLCGGTNKVRCCAPDGSTPAPAAPAPAPAQVCSPNTTQCSGGTLQVCNSAGSAWSNQYCTYGCANNACNSSPGCTPNCNGKCGGDNGCGGTCTNDCSGEQSCVNNVCVSKINGACGANNGKSLVDSPATDLCSLGVASGVTANDSGYSWTCAGDASTVNCSATKTSLKLSFKMTFDGITKDSTCLNNFRNLSLTVGKVGENVTQDISIDVNPVEGVANSNGLQVFEVSNIPINNTLAGSSNIYVKAKGSLHGKMFYCKNNQSGKYLGQVCDVSLDGSVNDFSNYPMIAGDINHDGVINTIDFSLMKNQSGSDEISCDQSGDITGDGKVNNFDLRLIKNALSYKDDE